MRAWAPRPHKEVMWARRAGVLLMSVHLLAPPSSETHTQGSYPSPLPLAQNFTWCTSSPALPGCHSFPPIERPLPQHPYPLVQLGDLAGMLTPSFSKCLPGLPAPAPVLGTGHPHGHSPILADPQLHHQSQPAQPCLSRLFPLLSPAVFSSTVAGVRSSRLQSGSLTEP